MAVLYFFISSLSIVLLASLTTASCPSKCSCSSTEVNCTGAGLTSWPTTLPSNTTLLILSQNQISNISESDFQLYKNLKTLDLTNNEISNINISSFHTQLETINLSWNNLQELNFLPFLPNLRHLDLSFNSANSIDNATFAKNGRLHRLSLDNNPVLQLETSSFKHNSLLVYLSLSSLEISEIPAKMLDPLTYLQYVSIQNNTNLEHLHDDLFYYQGNLKYLNIASNSLKSVPRSIRHLHSLIYLNLDDNPLQCDCQLFWFANWHEKKPEKLHLANGTVCSNKNPAVQQLLQLQCSAVQLETSTLFQKVVFGEAVVLTCNFSGNPAPVITWKTPDQSVLHWPTILESNNSQISLLSSGQLLVANASRRTAGDYTCQASNALSNVTAFMRIQITPTSFREVQLKSILVGFGCVFAFCFITMIVQAFRFIMDRYGWWECCYCCGRRLSPRAKQVRKLLEAVEQYKSQQLDRLRDNYTGQVNRIRDNCNQQMERIQQGYSGQVKYLRDYGTQQLTTIRDQYNDQAKKVYDYTVDRLQTVQRNYVSQRSKVGKFSAHQLIRLREKYKFQQKTLNKILENLPAFYIDSCRTATCARTDSIYFQDDAVDTVESIIKQGIRMDLPDVCLEDIIRERNGEDELMDEMTEGDNEGRNRKKTGHGRQHSAGSVDLGFLFAPIRFPSLNWRRRNVAVDEDEEPRAIVQLNSCGNANASGNGNGTEIVEVAVEICPAPDVRDITEDIQDVTVEVQMDVPTVNPVPDIPNVSDNTDTDENECSHL